VAPLFAVGLAVPLVVTAADMARDHPHQYVYFNLLAGRDLRDAKARFEFDYWGVSCRQALEELARRVPAGELSVWAATPPGQHNALILPPEVRRRFRFLDGPAEADYVLSHYRGHAGELPEEDDVCAVFVRGVKVAVVQRAH